MRISDWSSDVCSSDLSKVGHPVVYKVDGAVIGEQLPTVTTETGAIDDLYLKIVFLEHLSRNYELRIKVLLLRTIIGDRDAAELTRRSLAPPFRSEEHTSELQSLMRISYAVLCLQQKFTHMLTYYY